MKQEFSLHNQALFRTEPVVGEGGRGYLLRTAGSLELRSYYSVLDLAGVSHSGSVDDPENVNKFANSLRVRDLSKYFYTPIAGRSRRLLRHFLGHHVGLHFLTLNSPRVCPRCLSERDVCYSMWDLTFVTVCPKHGCQLIAQCPSCGRPLTWKRRRVQQCDCGADLTSFPATAAPSAELNITDTLYRNTGQHIDDALTRSGNGYPRELEDLSLNETLRLFSFLGQNFRELGGALTQANVRRSSLADVRAVIVIADRLLSNWPIDFRLALTEVSDRIATSARKGRRLQDVLHGFLSHMMRDLGEPAYRFLHQVCDDFVLHRAPAPFMPKRVLSEINGKASKRWISAPELAQLAGNVTPRQIRKYVRDGVLKGVITPGGKVGRGHIWIERRPALEWIADRAGWLSRSEARKRLGLTVLEIMGLGKAGVLEYKRGEVPGRSRSWNFLKSDIEKVLKAFSIDAKCHRPDETNRNCVTLSEAMGLPLWHKGSLPIVVRHVLEKKLLPRGRNSQYPGLMGCLFDKPDLRACILGIDQPLGDHISLIGAAKACELTPGYVSALIQQGILPAIRPLAKGKEILVSRKAIQKFRDKYVYARDLARPIGTHSVWVNRYLASVGVRAIALGASTRFKFCIYERDKVANLRIPLPKHRRDEGGGLQPHVNQHDRERIEMSRFGEGR